jgi:Fe2+ or Zn2+ uptake regulation protein
MSDHISLTARDLHERLERQGERVGLATVYRSLRALSDAGEVDQIRTDDGETAYRRCSRGHHHHLVCRSCGRTVEVEGPAVAHWADKMALPTASSTSATPWRSSVPAPPAQQAPESGQVGQEDQSVASISS